MNALAAGAQGAGLAVPRRQCHARLFKNYLFVAPAVVMALVFYVEPVIEAGHLSLSDWNISSSRPAADIGLDNYRELWGDGRFWIALRNTVVFALGVVPAGVAISLLLALLLERPIRGRAFFRTAFFLPVILPMVVAAMVWSYLFSAYGGLFNQILASFGAGPVRWLSLPQTAMSAVVVTSLWKGVGFNMVVFLAGLGTVPREALEAARMDGAGPMRRFFDITLPLMRATLLFALVVATIGSFQVFTQVFVMTQGGPAFSTTTLVYYIYHNAFENFRIGYAASIAMVLFALLLALSAIQFFALRRGYED